MLRLRGRIQASGRLLRRTAATHVRRQETSGLIGLGIRAATVHVRVNRLPTAANRTAASGSRLLRPRTGLPNLRAGASVEIQAKVRVAATIVTGTGRPRVLRANRAVRFTADLTAVRLDHRW